MKLIHKDMVDPVFWKYLITDFQKQAEVEPDTRIVLFENLPNNNSRKSCNKLAGFKSEEEECLAEVFERGVVLVQYPGKISLGQWYVSTM